MRKLTNEEIDVLQKLEDDGFGNSKVQELLIIRKAMKAFKMMSEYCSSTKCDRCPLCMTGGTFDDECLLMRAVGGEAPDGWFNSCQKTVLESNVHEKIVRK